MPLPALIFDLDGTLLDTLADLAAACNALLARHGWPVHPEASYRRFVGNGFLRLVARALPEKVLASLSEQDLARLVQEGKVLYAAGLMDATRPYPGMPEALDGLARAGVRLGVLSNKPHEQTRALIGHFFPGLFQAVAGGREGVPLKPSPEPLLAMAKELGSAPERTLYAGDSDVDARTAQAAGVRCLGAAWGFRGEAELRACGVRDIFQRPEDLVPFVRGLSLP